MFLQFFVQGLSFPQTTQCVHGSDSRATCCIRRPFNFYQKTKRTHPGYDAENCSNGNATEIDGNSDFGITIKMAGGSNMIVI
jgi:hypothetical protein